MAIIDLVSWAPRDPQEEFVFAYRFPETNLSTWTQLLVHESQEAILFSKGQLLQRFGPGKHTLDTENIPLLRSLFGIPFGGRNPFMAEVWFVNMVQPANLDWHTDSMSIQDVDYHTQLPLVASGRYGLRVVDAERFLVKLVGTRSTFTASDLTDQAHGEFMTKTKSCIVQFILQHRVGFKSISAYLDQLSTYLREATAPFWAEQGLELTKFYVTGIDIDTATEAGRRVHEAISQQSAQSITGRTWQQEQMFGVAQEAVQGMGRGTGGGMLGGIMALGMMQGMGGMGGGVMNPQYNQPTFGGQQGSGQQGPAFVQDGQQPQQQARMVYCSNCARKYPSTSKFCPYCGDPYRPCPNCGADNAEDARRCVSCGTTLQQAQDRCPSCGQPVAPGMAFCGNCGAPVITANFVCSRCGAPMPTGVKFCPRCGKKRD
ncbi:MAG: SPFH domain-containing protein [Bacteroidaceae bacterium]|nr:SPFH domain-containing protein [Bacteroidaceae bacterium]